VTTLAEESSSQSHLLTDVYLVALYALGAEHSLTCGLRAALDGGTEGAYAEGLALWQGLEPSECERLIRVAAERNREAIVARFEALQNAARALVDLLAHPAFKSLRAAAVLANPVVASDSDPVYLAEVTRRLSEALTGWDLAKTSLQASLALPAVKGSELN
jgi:hypothetical protein